jgi:hypothetical protein
LEDEMKRTEKFVDGILKKNKQELQKVAYGALHNYLFTKINDELIEPLLIPTGPLHTFNTRYK